MDQRLRDLTAYCMNKSMQCGPPIPYFSSFAGINIIIIVIFAQNTECLQAIGQPL